MNPDPLSNQPGHADGRTSGQSHEGEIPAAGTPEETHLTVKLMGEDWIIENGAGVSIGSARDRESAIQLAREAAHSQSASGISILAADGSLEGNLEV